MCCPGISMSCRSSQDAYEEETMSLNGITKQPGSTSEFNLKVGDPSLLDTIRAAGALVSDALDSTRVQRTSQFCHDSCRPWCADNCWSPFLCFFDCLCTCMITPEEQLGSEAKYDDLTAFIQQQRDEFGPICVGLAMSNGPWDISKLLAEGVTLSAEQKTLFSEKCEESKNQLGRCLKGGSQKELFKVANAAHLLPSKGSTELENVKSSLEESIHTSTPPSLPTCLILYPAASDETAAHEQRSGYSLNIQRLQHQLSQLEVLDMNSHTTGFLGFQARAAVNILLLTLNKYVSKEKNIFDHPGFGLSIEESKYRTLLLLSLLALGFVPLGAEQEIPTSLEQLENTSKELRTQEKRIPISSTDSRSFGTEVKVNAGTLHPVPKYGQRVVLNGRLTENAGTSCVDGITLEDTSDAELWDFTNPKSQEALLTTAQQVTAMTSSLFLR